MTGHGGHDSNTCKRILDLLEVGYLRLGEIVIKRITVIKFGVDDRGGNGIGCFRTEVRIDAVNMMNMITAGFRER